MKKIFLALFMFLFVSLSSMASSYKGYDIPVSISVNNNLIETENGGILIDNTTYVPVRFLANAIGITNISWNDYDRSATLVFNNKTLTLYTEKNYCFLNGEKLNLENNIILRNKRTLVPLRFIAEIFECNVKWDSMLYIAEITKHGTDVPDKLVEDEYTKNDILWLARLIEAESSGEPLQGKIAVGNVVLNRVKSKDFPDNIYDVIFDRKYGIQFQPTANNAIINSPSRESVIAGNLALNRENTAGKSLYFLNPKIATNFWIVNNRMYYKSINNHDFYL
jgi:N-acetylmuramoyl-L-alanine amidase